MKRLLPIVILSLATAAYGGTVAITTVTATKKVVTQVNTVTAQAETTLVLKKSGTTWIQDTSATNNAIETLTQTPAAALVVLVDCNGNGISDSVDISNGAADTDSDSKLDSCEMRYGDLNLNGVIDQQDVYILLGWWDIPNPLVGDLNGDTHTNAEDLGMLLARWGLVP